MTYQADFYLRLLVVPVLRIVRKKHKLIWMLHPDRNEVLMDQHLKYTDIDWSWCSKKLTIDLRLRNSLA